MLVKWTKSAQRDIGLILKHFLEIEEKDIGQKLVDRLFASVEILARFPNSGRLGQVDGTRELILPDQSYVLVYTISQHVEIARVLHFKQKWP